MISQKYNEQMGNYLAKLAQTKTKSQTNADRIRTMTDEELAECLYEGCGERNCDDCLYCREINKRDVLCLSSEEEDEICLRCWLEWLKKPVKDGADNV